MDYLFDLPKTKDNETGIFFVVDKLTKRSHIMPIEQNHIAHETARLFYKEIFRLHGLSWKNVSERYSLFTGTFWEELMSILKIKLNLSTSFHPPTDVQ